MARRSAQLALAFPPAIRALLALLALLVLFETNAAADGISGYVDYLYSNVSGKTEDSSGARTESKSDTFTQRYSLVLDRRLYPNFRVLAGGLFDKTSNSSNTAGQENDSTMTRMKPYVTLTLGNRIFSATGGYDRNEVETKSSSSPKTNLINENYFTTLSWKPVGLPVASVQYFRTNTFDKDKRTLDTATDRLQLALDYHPSNTLRLKYTGYFSDRMDHIQNAEDKSLVNDGKISYNNLFWDKRISLFSEYHVTAAETEVFTSGAGEVSFPLSPLSGLSVITDTPLDITLGPNLMLIDGNFAAGTGINLGLPTPGSDTRPRNMGVDFGVETQVNTLLVWVDRDLRSEIAGAFSWEVYTSSDNKTWVLRQTVFPAVFGPFETRFEIRFSDVTARYVKVVTRPLSPTVPFATDYPSIQVTELQALVRRPARDVQGKTRTTSHRYNLNARVRILDAPSLYYDFSYLLLKTGSSPARYDLSNGLSYNQQFGKIFNGSARVAREDGHQPTGDRVAYTYTASVAAVPLDTLRHSFIYSGRKETFMDQNTENNAFFLNNAAQLYPGVDANLGLGINFDSAATGVKTESRQVNGGMTLVPHRTMAFNLAHSDTTRKSSGGNLAKETTDGTRTSEVSVSFNPMQTLYLFASLSTQARTGAPSSKTWNYAASWSPLRDGALHFGFSYNETIDVTNSQKQRSIVPNLRWNIARGSYVDLTYEALSSDSPSLKTREEITSGRLHIAF